MVTELLKPPTHQMLVRVAEIAGQKEEGVQLVDYRTGKLISIRKTEYSPHPHFVVLATVFEQSLPEIDTPDGALFYPRQFTVDRDYFLFHNGDPERLKVAASRYARDWTDIPQFQYKARGINKKSAGCLVLLSEPQIMKLTENIARLSRSG